MRLRIAESDIRGIFGLADPEKYPESLDPVTSAEYDKTPLGSPTTVWVMTHKALVAVIVLGCLIGLIWILKG